MPKNCQATNKKEKFGTLRRSLEQSLRTTKGASLLPFPHAFDDDGDDGDDADDAFDAVAVAVAAAADAARGRGKSTRARSSFSTRAVYTYVVDTISCVNKIVIMAKTMLETLYLTAVQH